eukprot:3932626-Rhodomonas_salina.2
MATVANSGSPVHTNPPRASAVPSSSSLPPSSLPPAPASCAGSSKPRGCAGGCATYEGSAQKVASAGDDECTMYRSFRATGSVCALSLVAVTGNVSRPVPNAVPKRFPVVACGPLKIKYPSHGDILHTTPLLTNAVGMHSSAIPTAPSRGCAIFVGRAAWQSSISGTAIPSSPASCAISRLRFRVLMFSSHHTSSDVARSYAVVPRGMSLTICLISSPAIWHTLWHTMYSLSSRRPFMFVYHWWYSPIDPPTESSGTQSAESM